MTIISPNSVLPATREQVSFITSDSLTIVGELASPINRSNTVATVICVHPLPTHGGMMDSHILRKMSWRLPALANIAVLRFNTRGTTSVRGTSEGSFDASHGEGIDLAAAISFAQERGLPNIWVLGWSFGTDVILRNLDFTGISGAILLSPPLRYTSPEELLRWNGAGLPVHALIPEHDDYLVPQVARERFARAKDITIEPVVGAKHLLVGEKFVYQVLNRITELVAPQSAPLPTEWNGESERWTDLPSH
ncbi:MAG: alpha/beta hydrolase [Actinomycetia bacterium]|nr:alpha/beta hydrolase [Actinomycetes bacterium]